MPEELRRRQKIGVNHDGSFRLMWIVQGEKGAIEYHHNTDAKSFGVPIYDQLARNGFPGVEVHSRAPLYEGHTPLGHTCTILDGECYCDESSMGGETLRPLANEAGFPLLWAALEKRYRETFGEPAA